MPFNFFDPRSMAMGGAGVAVGDAATAPIYNPALLSTVDAKEKFSISLPVGVRVSDQDQLMNSIDAFQKGNYVANLDNAIASYNTTPSATSLNNVGTNAQTLSNKLATLSDKKLTLDGGAALVIGVPRKNWGFAFFANGTAEMSAVMKYNDAQLIADFNTATQKIVNCLTLTGSAQTTCATGLANNPTVAQFYSGLATGSTTTNFNANGQLKSTLSFRGAVLSELGFAVSNEFSLGNGTSFGLTPKLVSAQLIDYTALVNNASTTTPNSANYMTKYTMFNFDIGAAKNYNNGWRAGFVVKNIVPYSLDFKNNDVATGNTLTLKPQARVGGSWENQWATVAMDVDLTKNDPAGLGNASQFVALGGEVRAWRVMQLRAGYRADLVNSSNSVASLGLGFGFLPIDIAVAGNQNQIGASLQLAMHF